MAKVGEGDKRWIVQDRSDGKNVNAWHWEETDVFSKGKEKLRAIFKDLAVSELAPECSEFVITSADTIKGDMTLMNRKGRISFVYDFSMHLNFKGVYNTHKIKGYINFKEITVTDWPDVTFEITLENENNDTRPVKEVIKKKALPVIKQKLEIFIAEIKSLKSPQDPNQAKKQSQDNLTSSTDQLNRGQGGVAGTKDLKLVLTIQAPTKALYETLMDGNRVSAFTQSPAEISQTVGGKFKMFGGSVVGEQVEIVPDSLIKQKWRFQSWPEGHYSTVTYEFQPDDNNTRLVLTQTGIPENDFERTKEGWERFTFSRLKAMFGWDYKLE